MENPATWGRAEKVIAETLRAASVTRSGGIAWAGVIGWSTPRLIAEALREAGLLKEDGP